MIVLISIQNYNFKLLFLNGFKLELPLKAVSCTGEPAFIDDGGSADVPPMEPQADLPRQLPSPCVLTAHHPTPHGRTRTAGCGLGEEKLV